MILTMPVFASVRILAPTFLINQDRFMKTSRMGKIIALVLALIITPTIVNAGDFDWIKDFNIKAQLDPEGFKARLAARFRIGEADVTTVISNVTQPSDAYMVLRLGELSSRPTNEVIERYNVEKNQGWGVLAKSLGINPGSKEFHALKRGADLELNGTQVKNGNKGGQGKDKRKDNDKAKGKARDDEKGKDSGKKDNDKGRNNDTDKNQD